MSTVQCIAVHFGVPVSKARLSGSLCHSSRGGGGATGVDAPCDDDMDVDDDHDDHDDGDKEQPRGWGGATGVDAPHRHPHKKRRDE